MRLRRATFLVLFLVFAVLPATAAAQTTVVKPGHVLGWDQPAAASNPAQPSAYQFTLSIDGGAATALTATCVAPATADAAWHCTAPIPALTPGTHQLRIASSLEFEGATYASEGASEPLSVITIFVAIPTNVRLEPAPGGGL